ncbi:hypothetical protein DVH24_000812 [Malus domestica]|uniref:AMP-dependent synthetase/ligase domain-containing protein n=1 Tax=Malus domestica TaxID=3750 RepID=A0A498JZY7_MALDO|nr:hypothetical protein DVH24_000812 [Malus domestica]
MRLSLMIRRPFLQDFRVFISNRTDHNRGRTLYGKTSIHPSIPVVPLIDSGLMTPTMKIRRDRVVAQYKEQIDNLFK